MKFLNDIIFIYSDFVIVLFTLIGGLVLYYVTGKIFKQKSINVSKKNTDPRLYSYILEKLMREGVSEETKKTLIFTAFYLLADKKYALDISTMDYASLERMIEKSGTGKHDQQDFLSNYKIFYQEYFSNKELTTEEIIPYLTQQKGLFEM